MLTRTAVLFRVTGVVQILISVLPRTSEYAHPARVLALALIVCAESLVLCLRWLRSERIAPLGMTGDIVFCISALAANAALTPKHDALTWAFFMYGFTILVSIAVGIAFRRYRAVLAGTAALAAAYVLSSMWFGLERPWNAVPDTVSYFADTSVTWLVARELRDAARRLDSARAEAIANARLSGTESERLRHARVLHDRVLQTMECLASGPWVADDALRAHVAAEAAWLRALVRGDPFDQETDLLTALQAVVSRKSRQGMDVQLVDSSLRQRAPIRASLTAVAVEALCGAVEEALTNVAKHAGVNRAVVHASASAHRVVITVVDQGKGFEPARQPTGCGLPQSIRGRLQEAGGWARVESGPGMGTSVELAVDVTFSAPELGN